MPYTFDAETKEIVLPVGDTLDMVVTVNGYQYDAAVFAIYEKAGGEDILRVPAQIGEDGLAHIRLSNALTRDLEPGRYKWNLRLVSDPETDAEGNMIAEDASDDVLTVFGPENGGIPDLRLVRNGGRV